ncbi:RNA-directed DNA polymerase [Candidatus Palauibacter sp.]|uniref:RNA-directed DNA polymerase n=1 Tax=Candidatus Palauibacter sp. TaxID=3101350 RepID=UPI003B01F69F
MLNPYQQIVSSLDLRAALKIASRPSDLLPPRHEDKVTGEVGKRFTEHLAHNLGTSQYDPELAPVIPVPKSSLTTRPARVLTLTDRVVYEALVAPLRPRIDAFLLGHEVIFWPRGTLSADKRWSDFEKSPLASEKKYIVRADIAGFYETVSHTRLTSAITNATGYRDLASALAHFLNRIMGSSRGLPQGLLSSDALATLSLAELDFAMVRHGFEYFRHGDDIRIAVATYGEGRAAIHRLESELRRSAFLLNGAKTRILYADTYEREMVRYENALREAEEDARSITVDALADDPEALAAAMRAFDMEPLKWNLFYDDTDDFDDAIAELRLRITPDIVSVAERLFMATYERRPGSKAPEGELSGRLFFQQLKGTLEKLSAGESPVAIPYVAVLLRSFPETTKIVCNYLRSLHGSDLEIANAIDESMVDESTEWALAWMIRVLSTVPDAISESTVARVRACVERPWERWLVAVEAAKFLAAAGELRRPELLRLWNTCPSVFRVDVAVAAALLRDSVPWAKAFAEAAKSDPVHGVAIRHVEHA